MLAKIFILALMLDIDEEKSKDFSIEKNKLFLKLCSIFTMNYQGFIIWLSGKHNRKLYTKTLLFGLLFVAVNFLIACLIFNLSNTDQYSPLRFEISALGSIGRNPGWIFFTIGMISAGVILIPHILFLYRCLKPDIIIVAKISTIFLLLACIGMILVGIFPTRISYAGHLLGAISAFGGLALGMIFLIAPLLKKIIRDAAWPSVKLMLLFFLPPLFVFSMTAILVGMPVVQALNNNSFSNDIIPPIWPLCEWSMMISSLFCVSGLLFTCKLE